MKSFTFFLSFLYASTVLQAQNYQINFTGSGQSTTIDSIQIENLTQGTALSINGNDVLNLVGHIGVNALNANETNLNVYPNPMVKSTFIEFVNSKTELVCLEVFNNNGKLIAKQSTHVQQGSQRFKISGLNTGIYSIIVSTVSWINTVKIISLGKSAGNTVIEYHSADEVSSLKNTVKNTKDLVEMQYNDGEMILFKGFSGNYARVLTLLPTQNQTVNFEFLPCTDEDSNNYAIVTIGTQTWMAENLNYETANSWCYDNSSANGTIYGKLYTWDAALSACPDGWHLPIDDEWKTLEIALGMSQSEADDISWRGTDEGGKMKETGTTHWLSPNTGATNSSGFSAIPAGERSPNGNFYGLGNSSKWWSATANSTTSAWERYLSHVHAKGFRYYGIKDYGYSVRCLRD